MGLLSDIQSSLLNDQPVAPILLKLRFLASRLGSATLEEWVKHESEGYPANVDVPDYRQLIVSYVGSFNGAFGSRITNASIPSYLIAQHAGEHWLNFSERQSVSAIEALLESSAKSGGNLNIDGSNLMLILNNKIYEGMACHAAHGVVSRASIVQLVGSLRARVLELTLKLEKDVPEAGDISAGQASSPAAPEKAAVVTNITNQIMNGSVGANVNNSGQGAQFTINVHPGDKSSLAETLKTGGISEADADQVAELIASEQPDGDQPFGGKAQSWITANIGKAMNGTWKIGAAVATALLTDAAKKFYGLP